MNDYIFPSTYNGRPFFVFNNMWGFLPGPISVAPYDYAIFTRDEVETVIHSDDAFAPVGYINLKKLHFEEKNVSSEFILEIYGLLYVL